MALEFDAEDDRGLVVDFDEEDDDEAGHLDVVTLIMFFLLI